MTEGFRNLTLAVALALLLCGILAIIFGPVKRPQAPELTIDADLNIPRLVQIDVLQETLSNEISCGASAPAIRVAILSSHHSVGEGTSFDAAVVDPLRVQFGPGKAAAIRDKTRLRDVNGDGYPDLVLYFSVDAAGICDAGGPRRRDIELRGRTLVGKLFVGFDQITIGP